MKHPFLVGKQHIIEDFNEKVRAWDKKFRIIGKKDPLKLLNESIESLCSLPAFELSKKLLVDVGAGSGLMGLAWLLRSSENKVVFVESDLKKAAFIQSFFSLHFTGRFRCLSKGVELVSRETIDFNGPLVCVARAFSGPIGLKEAFSMSDLPEHSDIFAFFAETSASGVEKYILKGLNLKR